MSINIIISELPPRDVEILYEASPMVDNFEIHSTASSEISGSLRNQILGKPYRIKPKTTNNYSTIVPTKETARNSQEIRKAEGDSKDLSYHTVRSEPGSVQKDTNQGSGVSNQANSVQANQDENREVLSYHSPPRGSVKDSEHLSQKSAKVDPQTGQNQNIPMTNSTEGRYTTIETQTVAIQTVAAGTDPDLDCKCSYGDYHCDCPKCEPKDCRYGYSKKSQNIPDETSETYTESSCQTVNFKPRRKRCTCTCSSWDDFDSSITGTFSDSDDSCSTADFFDLPYQNNEDYMKMLRELEKKLIARNRERVRRTMMEFERRSRMNQNLEKPVCDYDDGESILQKMSPRKHKEKPACCKKCGKNKRVNSDIMQNEKRWDEMSYSKSDESPPRMERCLRKSHWQLDPRKGEWVKVSCFQQTDCMKNDKKRNECCCRKKRR